jgi:diguanylate cyclase (GGDEF)-like protein
MNSNNKLFLLLALAGFWLIISVIGCFLWIEADTRLLALSLLMFTTTMTLTNLFRFSGWTAALVSLVLYSVSVIGLGGINLAILPGLGVVIAAISGSFVLAELVRLEAMQINKQLDNSQKLIEELRQFDPVTGIMRYQQAQRLFRTEVVRSQRFEKDLCIFLLQIGNLGEILNERGADAVEALKRQVVGALVSAVRSTDIPFGGEKYGAILPETNRDGVNIVVDRLVKTLMEKVHVPVNIGIAQFPQDGVTDTELTNAAEGALLVAIKTDKSIVHFQQVRDMVSERTTG